ncbi:MAG: hypothetical protein H6706_09860 [Myxococcales bacterium]|nr:hypothetical protein [Myxococcales bacterium]
MRPAIPLISLVFLVACGGSPPAPPSGSARDPGAAEAPRRPVAAALADPDPLAWPPLAPAAGQHHHHHGGPASQPAAPTSGGTPE